MNKSDLAAKMAEYLGEKYLGEELVAGMTEAGRWTAVARGAAIDLEDLAEFILTDLDRDLGGKASSFKKWRQVGPKSYLIERIVFDEPVRLHFDQALEITIDITGRHIEHRVIHPSRLRKRRGGLMADKIPSR